jgi:hypothetical protein
MPLCRVETCGGLVHNQDTRVTYQCLGDTEALSHSPRESLQALLAHSPKVDLDKKLFDKIAPRTPVDDTFEDSEVIELVLRRRLRIETKVLGKVPQ